MGYPYPFPSLTPEQTAHRRLLLDKYGQLAQYSTLIPILLILLSRCLYYILHKIEISAKRKSAGKQKYAADDNPKKVSGLLDVVYFVLRKSIATPVLATWRRFAWWADGEIGRRWWWWGGRSSRRQAIVMGVWAIWLACLVFWETGDGKFLNPLCSFLCETLQGVGELREVVSVFLS